MLPTTATPCAAIRAFEEDMANIKSQIKRDKQNKLRRERNKAARSELKTRTKGALRAAESGAEGMEDLLRLAVKRIDKAAAKGIIHPNQASRRKSRLVRHFADFVAENSGE
jgi:small subunit ribosomal protein S20